MKPRRLIVTRGAEEAVKSLIAVSSQVSPETTIYSPQLREVLDVTTETYIYQVSNPKYVCIRDYSVVFSMYWFNRSN